MTKLILIDPAYSVFLNDRLFNDESLNRDNSLEPLRRLKIKIEAGGDEMHTADFLEKLNRCDYSAVEYYSLGIIPDFSRLEGVNLKAYILLEPPVVWPKVYHRLSELSKKFERLHLFNKEGDGYSLMDIEPAKLNKLYFPQPSHKILEPYWANKNRKQKIVVINGKHRPAGRMNELYSERINAIAALSKSDRVDLYGRGWEKLITRNSLWRPYLLNYRKIMKVYKGACESKYQVLSQYTFCLCFENSIMRGYVTEKIFDCLYAGTIPIYWGAPDIEKHVAKEAYIDFRQFENYTNLLAYIDSLSALDIEKIRQAGKEYIESVKFDKYYNVWME